MTREDLPIGRETDGGKRDHGCSLFLAEDLGHPANPVSGSGTSGEWMGKVEICSTQGCRGIRSFSRGQRVSDLLMICFVESCFRIELMGN